MGQRFRWSSKPALPSFTTFTHRPAKRPSFPSLVDAYSNYSQEGNSPRQYFTSPCCTSTNLHTFQPWWAVTSSCQTGNLLAENATDTLASLFQNPSCKWGTIISANRPLLLVVYQPWVLSRLPALFYADAWAKMQHRGSHTKCKRASF